MISSLNHCRVVTKVDNCQLLYPLRFHFPSIQRLPVRLQPIQIVMFLISALSLRSSFSHQTSAFVKPSSFSPHPSIYPLTPQNKADQHPCQSAPPLRSSLLAFLRKNSPLELARFPQKELSTRTKFSILHHRYRYYRPKAPYFRHP